MGMAMVTNRTEPMNIITQKTGMSANWVVLVVVHIVISAVPITFAWISPFLMDSSPLQSFIGLWSSHNQSVPGVVSNVQAPLAAIVWFLLLPGAAVYLLLRALFRKDSLQRIVFRLIALSVLTYFCLASHGAYWIGLFSLLLAIFALSAMLAQDFWVASNAQ
jgi:hypothetical protein